MSQKLNILITGATAGIGRHAALHLARLGHRVFATGRRKDALETLQREAQGLALETFELDVNSAESIAAAVAEVDRRTAGHGIEVLVNNAGYGLVGPLEVIPDEDLRAQFDTNVFGLMSLTRAFVPQMRKRGFGRILNVSSMAGRLVFPFMGAYHATKYALEALSDALRNELAPFGIGVVLIEPGSIRTEFGDRAMGFVDKYSKDAAQYSAVIQRATKIQKQFDAAAVGPECISRAMERAISARRPRARYVAPARTYVALAAFKLLPTRLMDFVLRTAMGTRRS